MKRYATPPPKRPASQTTPSTREKTSKRPVMQSLRKPRKIHQGNDDVLPKAKNTQTNITTHTLKTKTNKNHKIQKNKNQKTTNQNNHKNIITPDQTTETNAKHPKGGKEKPKELLTDYFNQEQPQQKDETEIEEPINYQSEEEDYDGWKFEENEKAKIYDEDGRVLSMEEEREYKEELEKEMEKMEKEYAENNKMHLSEEENEKEDKDSDKVEVVGASESSTSDSENSSSESSAAESSSSESDQPPQIRRFTKKYTRQGKEVISLADVEDSSKASSEEKIEYYEEDEKESTSDSNSQYYDYEEEEDQKMEVETVGEYMDASDEDESAYANYRHGDTEESHMEEEENDQEDKDTMEDNTGTEDMDTEEDNTNTSGTAGFRNMRDVEKNNKWDRDWFQDGAPNEEDLIQDSIENDIDNEKRYNDKNNVEDDESSIDTQKAGHNNMWGKDGPPPPHQTRKKPTQVINIQETEEDDVNSVNSDHTTHNLTEEEANIQVPPKCTRYNYSFRIEADEVAAIQELFVEGEKEVSNYAQRAKKALKEVMDEIKNLDSEAYLVSWEVKSTFKVLQLTDELPTATSDITTFFPGYRPQPPKPREGPVTRSIYENYVKLRVHHPNITSVDFTENMAIWAKSCDRKFSKSVIQAPNPRYAGWLVYSSNYTDTNYLSNMMKKKTGYEWGFKVVPCTNADKFIDLTEKRRPFKDRVKALHAVVDLSNLATAAKDICEIFAASPENSYVKNPIINFEDKFLFLEPEAKMPDYQSNLAFKRLVDRQKVHSKNIQGSFYPWINCDIDRKMIKVNQQYVSLRQLILSIPVMQKNKSSEEDGQDEETKFEPLFHGIDYTSDSRDHFFEGNKGPGGAGHIFSYYNSNRGEALRMIQGLGIYLTTKFGHEKTIANCLSLDHWKASADWKWDDNEKQFITKESKILFQNLLYDNNEAMIKECDIELAEKMEKEALEEQKKRKQKEIEEAINLQQKQKDVREKDESYIVAKKALKQSEQLWNKNTEDCNNKMTMLQLKEKEVLKNFHLSEEGGIDIQDLTKEDKREKIMEQITTADEISTTSSLTENSCTSNPKLGKNLMDMLNVSDGKDDVSNKSTTSSLKSFNEEFLGSLLDTAIDEQNMTQDEMTNIARAALEHQLKKVLANSEKLIASTVQGKMKKISSTQVKEKKGQSKSTPQREEHRKKNKKKVSTPQTLTSAEEGTGASG